MWYITSRVRYINIRGTELDSVMSYVQFKMMSTVKQVITQFKHGWSCLVLLWQRMVHFRFDLKQLHLFFWQPVLQLHETISITACGIGSLVIIIGTSLFSSSNVNPADTISLIVSPCTGSDACCHMYAWRNARDMWRRAASLVGGMSSGRFAVNMLLTRIESNVVDSVSLYSRHTNFSAFS